LKRTPPLETGRGVFRLLGLERTPLDIHPSVHSLGYWIKLCETYGLHRIGDLKPFIRRASNGLEINNCRAGQALCRAGFLGRGIWHIIWPIIQGTLICQKS